MPQEPNVFKDYVPGRLLILPSFELVLTVVAAVAVVLVAVAVVVVVLAVVVVVVEQALLWPAPDSPAIKVLHLKANITLETRANVSHKILHNDIRIFYFKLISPPIHRGLRSKPQ